MAEPALEISALRAGYGETVVLHDVSLTVGAGERVAIIGRNGAGKTTLLASIVGRARLHGGVIHLFGADLARLPGNRRAAAGLGLVPQEREVFPSLTVRENLLVARRPGRWTLDAVCELFPAARRTLAPSRQPAFGRRAADAGDRPGADGQSVVLLLLDEPLKVWRRSSSRASSRSPVARRMRCAARRRARCAACVGDRAARRGARGRRRRTRPTARQSRGSTRGCSRRWSASAPENSRPAGNRRQLEAPRRAPAGPPRPPPRPRAPARLDRTFVSQQQDRRNRPTRRRLSRVLAALAPFEEMRHTQLHRARGARRKLVAHDFGKSGPDKRRLPIAGVHVQVFPQDLGALLADREPRVGADRSRGARARPASPACGPRSRRPGSLHPAPRGACDCGARRRAPKGRRDA